LRLLVVAPLIFNECERLGWIIKGNQNTWKRRQWTGFKESPRSTRSVTTDTKLNREEDQYPIISNLLINMTYDIYNMMKNNKTIETKQIDCYKQVFKDAGSTDELIDELFDNKNKDIKKILRRIRTTIEKEEQPLYKNGIRMIIRELLRC